MGGFRRKLEFWTLSSVLKYTKKIVPRAVFDFIHYFPEVQLLCSLEIFQNLLQKKSPTQDIMNVSQLETPWSEIL